MGNGCVQVWKTYVYACILKCYSYFFDSSSCVDCLRDDILFSVSKKYWDYFEYRDMWDFVGLLIARSEGWWFEALSCSFLKQETLLHVVSVCPGV